MLTADLARKKLIDNFSYDLSEVYLLVNKAIDKNQLECFFSKGDSINEIPNVLDYIPVLEALGYKVRPLGPYNLHISWNPNFIMY